MSLFFFFKQKTAYEMRISDWSSDVCSSDLIARLRCCKAALGGVPMKATIWHNPACGTSRKTLAILEETPGVELTVVEYLKKPYSADKLRQLFLDAGIGARDALRLRGTDAEARGLKDRKSTRLKSSH